MKLYRLKLNPCSAWRTPWHADTLFGLLCATLARQGGADVLRKSILGPSLAGEPPFVLSDAFPADLLPMPLALRLHDWPAEQRKQVKKARWLRPKDFRAVQAGEHIPVASLLPNFEIESSLRAHVTPSRTADESEEGGLHWIEEHAMASHVSSSDDTEQEGYLSVYARVRTGREDLLQGLFEALAQSGFGADCSAGLGRFDVISGLESADWLDSASQSSGLTVLSTFQPAESDPTDGCWEMFTKHGKIGPDFGIENVFKRPLLLLRPGACFASSEDARRYLGHALPMQDYLEENVCAQLEAQRHLLMHPAFGLAVPYQMETNQ